MQGTSYTAFTCFLTGIGFLTLIIIDQNVEHHLPFPEPHTDSSIIKLMYACLLLALLQGHFLEACPRDSVVRDKRGGPSLLLDSC